MIKESYKKQWDYVIVYKLDRFSRDKYATAIYKKTLKDNGVKVLSAMENIPDSPEGIILESLLEGMNQYYSAELSQKVKRGMKELRIKGNWQGGNLPYGYDVSNKKVILKDIEAENVKYIFSQVALGIGARTIIENLEKEGRLYTGRNLSTGIIYQMVRNTRYMGWYKKGDELVDNMFPAIISQELFERVQNILPKSNKGSRSEKTVYLLRTKLKCGYCGENINGDTGTSYNGKKKHYYTCVGRRDRRKKFCKKSTIQKEYLEQQILSIIVSQFGIEDNRNFFINKILEYQEKHSEKNEEIEILLKEQKRIETEIKNINEAIKKGFLFESTLQEMRNLENQKITIENAINQKEKRDITKLTKKDITTFLDDALKKEPLELFEILIKKIVIYDDKKEIYFNSPLKDQSPDDNNQDFLFYLETISIDNKPEIIRFYL